MDPNVDKAVTRVFTEYTNWYMMLRIEEHTETTLERLDQAGKTLLLSLKVFTDVSGPLSKVSFICHMISCYVIWRRSMYLGPFYMRGTWLAPIRHDEPYVEGTSRYLGYPVMPAYTFLTTKAYV